MRARSLPPPCPFLQELCFNYALCRLPSGIFACLLGTEIMMGSGSVCFGIFLLALSSCDISMTAGIALMSVINWGELSIVLIRSSSLENTFELHA